MGTTTKDGVTIKTNGHVRELLGFAELPNGVAAEWFDYVDAAEFGDTGEEYAPRFFCYRGSWYDTYEFEGGRPAAPDWIRVAGFNAWQTESAFSAVLVRYFDADGYEYDGAIVVGYAHW